ncbi:hypothetical protein XM53_01065 [Roseovarius atlanticus]|uniref:Methyltransferase n=1 Tax=Roseovarius atlanticus TaxID=1641875 RepID=A0A0T5NZP1_9RHOB|nr:hypothetical protein [Roseovarius atlanticus]KRS14352.1 hypothetical protein XM53_01065 [Roseovarius atlanticus]
MTPTATISRPELTLPEAEAEVLRAAYAGADVILEYGSGGSTVMAGEMPGKRVFSVESDKDWALMMRGWFDENAPAKGTEVDVIWSDIGPTKEWGYPTAAEQYMRYPRYPLEVWDLPEFRQPDVVLVDGRFRTGCALATALRTERPVQLFVDDYKRRKQYHGIEKFIGAPRMTGRMAGFEVEPLTLPQSELLNVIEMMLRP